MARVSIDDFRKWIHADDVEGDDSNIQLSLLSAESQVNNAIGYSAEELAIIPDSLYPNELRMAIMTRAATLYAVREDTSNIALHRVPGMGTDMIQPYKRMRGGSLIDDLITKCKAMQGDGES